MAKKSRSVVDAKPDELKDVRERFNKIADLWDKDRERYKSDSEFSFGNHWPEAVKRKRDADERLSLVVDKLDQYLHQVINTSRQNRPQIVVRPIDSDADIATAETFDGLCRHIQERSNADGCYDTALECATRGGYGFIRLLHEYAHEHTFDQELAFGLIPNPLQVYFGTHKELDGSDVMDVFIAEDIPREEFKAEHPDIDATDWDGAGDKYGDWVTEDKVRVVEYFRMVKVPREMLLLDTGEVISAEDYQIAVDEKVAELSGVPLPGIKDRRMLPTNVVKWSKLCGSGYIEPEIDTIWKWIPVVPVWGNLQNLDGEVRHVSMIHAARDAQLLYDYSRSAFAERVGQTPEAPWVAAAGQIEEHEDEWNGTKRVRVQRYDPIDIGGQALPPPARQSPSDIPAGFAQDAAMSEHDIQGALGMYQASLGRQGNATSGIQEREQALKGDIATFHYHDNLARAIRHCGRILVAAIPKVYDAQRVVRILGEGGEASMVHLDASQPKASQQVGRRTIYNLGAGTYDVAVTTGASYTTQRQEFAANLAQLATSDPTFLAQYGDIYFHAQDWPGAQQMADRAKLFLPPAVQQAEQKDGSQSPEVQAATAPLNAALQQSHQQMQAMAQELQKLQGAEQSKQAELAVRQAEINLKMAQQATAHIQAQTALVEAKKPAEETVQYKIAELNNAAKVAGDEWLSKKANEDTANEAAAASNSEISSQMGAMTAQPMIPDPAKVSPLESILQAHAAAQAQTQAQFAQHGQMLHAILQHMAAPRQKNATAVRQPDGSYVMQSTEAPMAPLQ